MQQSRYKVVAKIGGKRITQYLLAYSPQEAMQTVKGSIVFEHCCVVEPSLNLVQRINDLFTIK